MEYNEGEGKLISKMEMSVWRFYGDLSYQFFRKKKLVLHKPFNVKRRQRKNRIPLLLHEDVIMGNSQIIKKRNIWISMMAAVLKRYIIFISLVKIIIFCLRFNLLLVISFKTAISESFAE